MDRALGGRIVVEALRNAGQRVERHSDHFADDAPDITWLREVGARQWVVLTKDQHIRTRVLEREALLHAGVRSFILAGSRGGNMRGQDMADLIVRNLRRMEHVLHVTPPPFIAAITAAGVRLYDV